MISGKIELTLWKLEPSHLHKIWGMPLHDKASNLFVVVKSDVSQLSAALAPCLKSGVGIYSW